MSTDQPSPTDKERYQVVSFSLYQADIDEIERIYQLLTTRDGGKWNKSMVVRAAIKLLDIKQVKTPY